MSEPKFTRLELSDDASVRVDDMMELARTRGLSVSPSELLNDAILAWHGVALGWARIIIDPTMCAAAGKEPGQELRHTLDVDGAARWH